jgi:hypothetical protein
MKRLRRRIVVTVVLALALAACSGRDPSTLFAPDAGTLVVSATLITGQLMPPIFITETVAPDEPLDDLSSVVVREAVVNVSFGSITLTYAEDASGIYWPPPGAPLVLYGTTYRLLVVAPNGRTLRAATTTPDSFVVDQWVLLDDTGTRVLRTLKPFNEFSDPDSAYTHPDNQLVYTEGLLEAQFRRGPEWGYQVGLFALADTLVRSNDSDLIEDEDLDRELSSNAIEALDGKIRLPWFAIQWEGPFMTRIFRVDLNWFDYIRSLGLDGFGFGGNAGDNFESPIFHVEGGIGLFGSAASDSIGFNILPR